MTSFILFNFINVIMQTVKSIVTVKCNKYIASIVNAVTYAVYAYIIVLMASDINLWVKILVTGGTNLIGVFVVKLIEEKRNKEKLWVFSASVPDNSVDEVRESLNEKSFSYSILPIENSSYKRIEIFAPTSKDSDNITKILKEYNAKFYITESKNF